ncbi:MAG: carboxypeptidase regulatory-like domain-containing protein [Nannocystaceae bacterium]|nr:carboxypeptidase regulatory-like domain-containing protein [Nannocystaceae bacterium]
MRLPLVTAALCVGLWVGAPMASADASGCEVKGVVHDADGHSVVGIEVTLSQDGSVRRTTTDGAGRYRFVATNAGPMQVALVLVDGAHEPPWFQLDYENRTIEIQTDSFSGEGTCERNFDFAAPDDRYPEGKFPRHWWADAITLYRGFAGALSLSEDLGIDLGATPLQIHTFYASASADTTFWVGTPSYAPDSARPPFVGLGVNASTRADLGWPSNREDHEIGHHVLAQAFGGVHPRARNDTNHGGYWVNPTSADAWTEGFASFYAVMVAKHVRKEARPHWLTIQGAVVDLELDYRPWDLGGLEEIAVAALLLDLEDGPEDYATDASTLGLSILETNVSVHDGTSLVHGLVAADSGAAHERIVDLELVDDADAVVGRTRGIVVFDPGAADPSRGRFTALLPEGIVAQTVRLVSHPAVDDDPVHIELKALWQVITEFESSKDEGHGHLLDVDDLHTALLGAFGGHDVDNDGVDDIDQVFIAHGLFADNNANGVHDQGEAVGQTGHPGSELTVDGQASPRPALTPRFRATLPAALRTSITLESAPNATVVVVATAQGYAPVVYAPKLDPGGHFVLVPPPVPTNNKTSASVAVLALAPGKQPAVVAQFEAGALLAELQTHSAGYLSLTANLKEVAQVGDAAATDLRVVWGMFVGGTATFVLGLLMLAAGVIRRR